MILDPNKFNIPTSAEEKTQREELCYSCAEYTMMNQVPTCNKCACPIGYVVSQKYKKCPLEKWTVED